MTHTLDWTENAACRPHPDWTAERRPEIDATERMAAICSGCPVRLRCAAYALDSRAESGFYAGVWVPPAKCGNRPSTGWRRARQWLRVLVEGSSA
jgi:hypothetical protein